MAAPLTIALDAMGGDDGPEVVIPGADLFLRKHYGIDYLLFGHEAKIMPILKEYPKLQARAKIMHTEKAVAMDAKPSQALRAGRRDSSMWNAIESVRNGVADFVVSAGNTGALMAMSKICLKTVPEIDRPAIAAVWPTMGGQCIVLDVGANVGASARQLGDFAFMGAAMARALFHIDRPSVSLLNIGVEEVKGLSEVKNAHRWLADSGLSIDYRGFVEGNMIGHDAADVIVTEGFSGNIALKTAEGTAQQFANELRVALSTSLLTRLGGLLARSAFSQIKKKLDPNDQNGGVFLGLNGIVIKCHGGANANGFARAIETGYDMAQGGLVGHIKEDLNKFHVSLDAGEVGQ